LQFLISVAIKFIWKTNIIDIRYLTGPIRLLVHSIRINEYVGFFLISIVSKFPLLSTSLGYALIINRRLIWQIFLYLTGQYEENNSLMTFLLL